MDDFDTSSPGVQAELATGKAYVHSAPDRFGRPVVVIRVRKHVIGEFPAADSKRLCGHILDQAVAALPPGGEQIAGVFDLKGFGLQNADLQFAGFLVEAFFEFYPRRCAPYDSFRLPLSACPPPRGRRVVRVEGGDPLARGPRHPRSRSPPLPPCFAPSSSSSSSSSTLLNSMGQVLMVDAPWVFRPTWEVIKPL